MAAPNKDLHCTLTTAVDESFRIADRNGFWERYADNDEDQVYSTKLMLVVTELAEACELLRKGEVYEESSGEDSTEPWSKIVEINNPKTGLPHFREELADAIIRLMDLGVHATPEGEMHFADVIMRKIRINAKRPYKHGKKF